MALAMPVWRRKQSARLAAVLNSPPLTWIAHSVALRKGITPGSRRWTSAPRDRKSRAPSGRMFRPELMGRLALEHGAPRGVKTRVAKSAIGWSARGFLSQLGEPVVDHDQV